MGTSGMQMDCPEKLKYPVKNSWGLSFQKLLLLLLSLRWLPSLSLEIGFFFMVRNTAITLPEFYILMDDGLNYTFSSEKLKITRGGRFVASAGRLCPFLDQFSVLWGREDGVIDEHGHFLRTTWFDSGKSISKRMGVKFIERGTVDR